LFWQEGAPTILQSLYRRVGSKLKQIYRSPVTWPYPCFNGCKYSIIIKNITFLGRMQILGDQGFRCPAFALQATAGRCQVLEDRWQMTENRRPPFAQRASEGRQMTEGEDSNLWRKAHRVDNSEKSNALPFAVKSEIRNPKSKIATYPPATIGIRYTSASSGIIVLSKLGRET